MANTGVMLQDNANHLISLGISPSRVGPFLNSIAVASLKAKSCAILSYFPVNHSCTVRGVEAPVRGPGTYRSRTVPDPGTGIVDFEFQSPAPGVTAEWLSKLNIPLCNLQIGLRVR